MAGSKLIFAKVAGELDQNPRIRRAGRNGREVYLFVLRRNATLDANGLLPDTNVDPWYLADQLMMSEKEAASGLSSCVRTGLLTVGGGYVTITGWDDEWARRPLTEAERKREQRARQRKGSTDVEQSHDLSGQEGGSPESHAVEERREEETREEERRDASPPAPRASRSPREPSGPHQAAVAEFDAYYQRTREGSRPTWNGKTGKLMAGLVGKHGLPEIVKRIAELEQRPPTWPPPPWDFVTFAQHFDKLAPSSQGALPVTGRYEPVLGQRVGGEVEL